MENSASLGGVGPHDNFSRGCQRNQAGKLPPINWSLHLLTEMFAFALIAVD